MGTKTRITLVVVLAAGAFLAALASYHEQHLPIKNVAVAPSVPARPATPVTPAMPPLDPLTIAAIKAKSYPASAIMVQQNLGEQGGYSTKIVSYQSDGYKINALLVTPGGTAPAGGWPVIIFNHGYIAPTSYSTISSYSAWVGSLAKGGFMVIKPDYRGNAQSEGQPEGGHFSPVYTYDVLNLVSSIKNLPGANASRIGMFGHSMGGHETLRAIVSSPNIKASVFAAGVVGSFYDIFYNWPSAPDLTDQPVALTQGVRQALITKYGDPKSDPAFWSSASAINYVSQIKGPVLVNQDVSDSVVPKVFADHLVAALQQAGKSMQYYTYPGDDHNFSSGFNLLMSRSVAFFQQNL